MMTSKECDTYSYSDLAQSIMLIGTGPSILEVEEGGLPMKIQPFVRRRMR